MVFGFFVGAVTGTIQGLHDRNRRAVAQYTTGWTRGQVDLVAALLQGRFTLDWAEANLNAAAVQPPAGRGWYEGQVALVQALRDRRITLDQAEATLSTATMRHLRGSYERGWYEGQVALVQALRDRRITLRAAAVNLGMMLPDELPGPSSSDG